MTLSHMSIGENSGTKINKTHISPNNFIHLVSFSGTGRGSNVGGLVPEGRWTGRTGTDYAGQ